MTYSELDKQKIIKLRNNNVSWENIGIAVGKNKGAVRKWYCKNRANFELPEKPKITKKKTDGRVGLQIKKIVSETPQIKC